MPRILVSRPAVAVATVLRAIFSAQLMKGYGDEFSITLRTSHTAQLTGFTSDTVYRALIELDGLEAVSRFESERDGARLVWINERHWVFTAIADQAGA